MGNKLLKVGDWVDYVTHNYDNTHITSGIGIIVEVQLRDYIIEDNITKLRCYVSNTNHPERKKGGYALDTISLIEEEEN